MPATCVVNSQQRPAPNANNLNMRAIRFRLQALCISWGPREGSLRIKRALAAILGPECIRVQSSRGFGRDLTKEEVQTIQEEPKEVEGGKKGKTGSHKKSSQEEEEDIQEEAVDGSEATNRPNQTEQHNTSPSVALIRDNSDVL